MNSGLLFDFRDVENSPINLLDIIHSLSTQNRYNGALNAPISVGQHLLLCQTIFEREYDSDKLFLRVDGSCNLYEDLWQDIRLVLFLHDMHEAYTGDSCTGFKKCLRFVDEVGEANDVKVIEGRIDKKIYEMFECMHLFDDNENRSFHEVISEIDQRALFVETALLGGYYRHYKAHVLNYRIGEQDKPLRACDIDKAYSALPNEVWEEAYGKYEDILSSYTIDDIVGISRWQDVKSFLVKKIYELCSERVKVGRMTSEAFDNLFNNVVLDVGRIDRL